MATGINTNPAVIAGAMALGWRANQTLNQGNMPSTAQQLSGPVARQTGVTVNQVLWTGMSLGATFTIIDPGDSTVLLQGVAGATLGDQFYTFNESPRTWRDWQVNQLSNGTILIWYRF